MSEEQQSPEVSLASLEKGVAVIRIDRPEARNALNTQVRRQLAKQFTALTQRDDVRTIVLTGGETVLSQVPMSESLLPPLRWICINVITSSSGNPLPAAPSRLLLQ